MQVNKNTFRINIKIDGRTYPLNVNRADEERYRLAAKMVNETVMEYKKMFPDKSSQDIIAMSAFQVALNYTDLLEREDKSQFIDELENLNDDISDFLKERK